MNPGWFEQLDYDLRFDWGVDGVGRAAARGDQIVVVDVLSFSTCCAIACARGVTLIPCSYETDANELAGRHAAELAVKRGETGWSLSPAGLRNAPNGLKLVLPSPNGSACCEAGRKASKLILGCLLNAGAASRDLDPATPATVIAAGERWPDGTLRVAVEDLIGSGAVLSGAAGRLSPEAMVAVAAFERANRDLRGFLRSCGSGIELIEKGFEEDVEIAARLNELEFVPRLHDGTILS